MISQLAECRVLSLNSLRFSRTYPTVCSAQSAVASLRAPSPFASRIHVSGLHHNSRISDASARNPGATYQQPRPAQAAARHRLAPQTIWIDDITSDCASLDRVSPEESLKRAESWHSASTLDTNPNCGTAAYPEVEILITDPWRLSPRPLELIRLVPPRRAQTCLQPPLPHSSHPHPYQSAPQ